MPRDASNDNPPHALAPSAALGHMFGRLGCFMNGCCYGKACSLPWAVHFPFDHETHGLGVHPTQIYESIGNLLIFIGLSAFYPKRKFDGQISADNKKRVQQLVNDIKAGKVADLPAIR